MVGRVTQLVVALGLGACGRLGFESVSPEVTDAPLDDVLDVDAAPRASCPGMADVPDEDADLVGDPCDRCPHVADATQPDGDGDGVGDACDPAPADPRQRLRFFHGFNTALPQWSGGGQLVGGQLVLDMLTGESVSILSIPTTGATTLQMAGSILAVGAPTPQLFLGIDIRPEDLYYAELISDNDIGRRRSLMHAIDDVFTEYEGVRETNAIQPGPFLFALAIGTDRIDAIVETAGASPAVLGATGTGVLNGRQGVMFVGRLSVVIDYAILIETVPAT
ncbi:MAG: hypothetical protein H0T89_09445 [Deltaproteobacteria bacterium]|nr:hypothetical protein [Deltaproteobacteria bacterium]MDQ3299032.1 hypothetical protein [Myxococcota bacterium]